MSDLLKKNLEEDSIKRSPKRIISLVAFGAIPLGIGICFIQVPIGCACGDQGIQMTSNYVSAQEAYHLEHQTFSKSKSIGSIPEETDRYLFSTEVTSDKAYIYATPREVPTDLFRLGLTKAKIYARVGAVAYDEKRKETVSIVCVAQGGTLDKLTKPIFDGEKFTCPNGFVGSSRSGRVSS